MASVKTCIFLVLVLAGWQLGVVFGHGPDEDGGDENDEEPGAENDEEPGAEEPEGGEGGGQAEPGGGGTECTRNESNHQVLLMTMNSGSKTKGQIRCSGSLIDQNWVLTDANCYHSHLEVVQSGSGKNYKIKKTIKIESKKDHDISIMLLKLDRSNEKKEQMKDPTIGMPDEKMCTKLTNDKKMLLMGWKEATALHTRGGAVNTGTLPLAMCSDLNVNECLRTSDTCTGDKPYSGHAGGAFIYDGLLYGIVKFEDGESHSIKYTNICLKRIREWITKQTEGSSFLKWVSKTFV
ncbi:trypsin-2-like [Sardina pilchardus]|uniref:trypsin-2-like n=1 Tax=Sardina pilchardus TaxID=27697 RepID=UPI002E14D952